MMDYENVNFRTLQNRVQVVDAAGSGRESTVASFLAVARRRALLMTPARPRPGATIAVRFTEPIVTDWIFAVVLGGELAGGGPYQTDISFSRALPEDLLASITSGHPSRNDPEADVSSRRVLIVDDHEGTRHALASYFRRKGFGVDTAGTVAEGISRLTPPPTFLVLDLMLPDGAGEEILRRVRHDDLPTRVAVCTGIHDPRRLALLELMLPQAVLQKPISPDDMECVFADSSIG